MRKYFPYVVVTTLFLAIVIPTIVFQFTGSNAEINLTAPKSYQVGDLVVLDATDSVAARLNWTILPKTKNFKIVGKTAYFSSSAPDRYTIIITATNNGTLATKVFFLNPGTNDPGINDPGIIEPGIIEPLKIDPKVQRLAILIDGGIITTLDAAVLAALKLGVEIPEFKNFEEFKQWVH